MRLWNWQQNLANLIKQKKTEPFEWGVNDCFLFVADAIKSINGLDVAYNIRGTYGNEFSGMRLMLEGVGIEALDLHFERKPTAMAAIGDVGLFVDDREMFGVIGHGHGIVVSKTGYDVISIEKLKICWSI